MMLFFVQRCAVIYNGNDKIMFSYLQDDFDYTSADNQKLLYDYHQAFLKIDSIIKKEDGSLPNFWLQEFRSWLLGTIHNVVTSSQNC